MIFNKAKKKEALVVPSMDEAACGESTGLVNLALETLDANIKEKRAAKETAQKVTEAVISKIESPLAAVRKK